MRRFIAMAASAGLLLVACGEDEAQQVAMPDPDAPLEGASVEITSPSDGDAVTPPFDLQFSVTGVELGPPETGLRHLHVYVGDADFVTHESTEPFTVEAADGGDQPIRVVLAEANHNELGVSDQVQVAVAEGAAPAEDDEGPARTGY